MKTIRKKERKKEKDNKCKQWINELTREHIYIYRYIIYI